MHMYIFLLSGSCSTFHSEPSEKWVINALCCWRWLWVIFIKFLITNSKGKQLADVQYNRVRGRKTARPDMSGTMDTAFSSASGKSQKRHHSRYRIRQSKQKVSPTTMTYLNNERPRNNSLCTTGREPFDIETFQKILGLKVHLSYLNR